ncbi:MAG: leucyl aminopeptidase [Pseudomonadota bacterium]
MKISFAGSPKVSDSILVLSVAKGANLGPHASKIDETLGGAIAQAIKVDESFDGSSEQVISVVAPADAKLSKVFVLGLGDPAKLTEQRAVNAGGSLCANLNGAKVKGASVQLDLPEGSDISVELLNANVAFGALLRSYSFDLYKTSKSKDNSKPSRVERLTMASEKATAARKQFGSLQPVAEGVFLARDLVSEPPNVLHPESYAERCKELTKLGVEVTILDEKKMAKLGMNALLAVGMASDKGSRLVVMRWKGAKNPKGVGPIAFVGKGVTFDTGGISLKPAAGMWDMKFDMGGAAAVTGAIAALAGRKAKADVVGIIGLVENMPAGNAQRPGDVVTSAAGKTIEVLNTDAEGRLVLADALWYAQSKYKPRLIVDLATLTGAMMVALGHEMAGLFSNDDDLSDKLLEAGLATDELVWRMPLAKSYDRMINSNIADVKNIGAGRWAGSIVAAQFLQRFVENGTPWAHLDIAGTAWSEKTRSTTPKGAVGWGVRLLSDLVKAYE